MIMEARRLAQILLLGAAFVGCASQHHRTETASEESSETALTEGDREGADTTPVASDDSQDRRAERAVRDETDEPADRRPDDKEPDNTGVNERDRDDQTLTAGDQSNSDSDLEITRRIRETVVEDDSLSFTAKNVKIITVDGRVTLRGPVRSEAERATIEKKAVAVAGAGQVENQLEIK
jgi:hyperosmotically inducible protein